MPTSARYALAASGGERWRSALAVTLIHLGLGAALISGLGVRAAQQREQIAQLVEVPLDPPPPPFIEPLPKPAPASKASSGAAPRAPDKAPPGGSPGPVKRSALPAPVAPIVLNPVPAGGGGVGTSSSIGAGSGGGSGGNGSGSGDGDGAGDGDGGTDLEQIAGEIRRSDYPRAAREARIGGRVEFRFTVGTDGRVSRCTVTRSSGLAELDATTCRLVTERFRYRPTTDSRGRPITDEVEGEHVWSTSAR